MGETTAGANGRFALAADPPDGDWVYTLRLGSPATVVYGEDGELPAYFSDERPLGGGRTDVGTVRLSPTSLLDIAVEISRPLASDERLELNAQSAPDVMDGQSYSGAQFYGSEDPNPVAASLFVPAGQLVYVAWTLHRGEEPVADGYVETTGERHRRTAVALPVGL